MNEYLLALIEERANVIQHVPDDGPTPWRAPVWFGVFNHKPTARSARGWTWRTTTGERSVGYFASMHEALADAEKHAPLPG